MAQQTAEQHLSQSRTEAERLLAEARQNADAHLTEAQTRAATHLNEAQARADHLDRESTTRANQLIADAEQRAGTITTQLEQRKDALERRVEQLRTFEREYRTRLKSYLESQLRDLDASGRSDPAASAGQNEHVAAGAAAARPELAVPSRPSPAAHSSPLALSFAGLVAQRVSAQAGRNVVRRGAARSAGPGRRRSPRTSPPGVGRGRPRRADAPAPRARAAASCARIASAGSGEPPTCQRSSIRSVTSSPASLRASCTKRTTSRTSPSSRSSWVSSRSSATVSAPPLLTAQPERGVSVTTTSSAVELDRLAVDVDRRRAAAQAARPARPGRPPRSPRPPPGRPPKRLPSARKFGLTDSSTSSPVSARFGQRRRR